MFPRWLACVLALLALVGFGSCKGGESGPAVLKVLDVEPEDRDTEIPVETRIGFRIDGTIHPESLTNETFFLTSEDGTVVPSTVFVGDTSDIAELDPDSPLDVITTYTATVTTGLLSTDDRSLEKDFIWEFTTVDSAWGVSEWLELIGTGVASQPQIAVDRQDNALAIWQYTDAAGDVIWANHYTRVDLWEDPEPIDDGSGTASAPALAVDQAGNGIAIWERLEGVTTNIWTNRYDVDDGWGTAGRLQNGEVTDARSASLAVDPAGNALAVWIQDDVDTGEEFVWAIRYEPGTGWGTAASIDVSPAPTSIAGTSTDVGMDANGNGLAVWSRPEFMGDVIWANRYTAGSGWGTAAIIKSDVDTDVRGLRLDVAPNGDAFIVWIQNDPARDDTEDIWSARFSGSSWGPPERIDQYDAGDKMAPDIAIDGDGIAHAVWSQADADFDNIWANQYTRGSGWGMPQLIEPPNEDSNQDGDARDPRVDVNTAGNTFVVWTQIWQGWASTWSNRLDPGTGWMTAELIEDLERPAKQPKIAVDESRHAHAVWVHSFESGLDWVRTNRFE